MESQYISAMCGKQGDGFTAPLRNMRDPTQLWWKWENRNRLNILELHLIVSFLLLKCLLNKF